MGKIEKWKKERGRNTESRKMEKRKCVKFSEIKRGKRIKVVRIREKNEKKMALRNDRRTE